MATSIPIFVDLVYIFMISVFTGPNSGRHALHGK